MGKILVIAEKPSLGRSIAGAISWWKGEKFERQEKTVIHGSKAITISWYPWSDTCMN